VGLLTGYWHKTGASWLAEMDLQRADVLHQDQPGVVPAVLQLVDEEVARWGWPAGVGMQAAGLLS
jgi:hypothetical protein